MKDAIHELEMRINKYCKESFRCDEELFNLGVELGRLLEQEGLPIHRPKFFIDAETKNNLFEQRLKIIRRIDSSLEYLFKNAIAEQIDTNGPFEFSSDSYRNSTDKFDSDISEKFHLQVIRTKQREVGGSFDVELVLTNEVASIFTKYNEAPYALAQLDNSTGDTSETIYRRENIEKIFSVASNIGPNTTQLSLEQLETFATDIEKIIVWFNMSLNNPIQISTR